MSWKRGSLAEHFKDIYYVTAASSISFSAHIFEGRGWDHLSLEWKQFTVRFSCAKYSTKGFKLRLISTVRFSYGQSTDEKT